MNFSSIQAEGIGSQALCREEKMEAIVITNDELAGLERRFGPRVRQMGLWNSDGTFGYSSVPIAALERAAESLQNPDLVAALSRLKQTQDQTRTLIDLLQTFGPSLVERIVAAYRECSLEWIAGRHHELPQRDAALVH